MDEVKATPQWENDYVENHLKETIYILTLWNEKPELSVASSRSRLEAFWRTILFAAHGSREYPLRDEKALDLREWLLETLSFVYTYHVVPRKSLEAVLEAAHFDGNGLLPSMAELCDYSRQLQPDRHRASPKENHLISDDLTAMHADASWTTSEQRLERTVGKDMIKPDAARTEELLPTASGPIGDESEIEPKDTPCNRVSAVAIDEYLRNHYSLISQRLRLFVTSCGNFGKGYDILEPGDVICIIKGAEIPYIIRPLANGQYNFIGQCYVHGIMHGEAVVDVDEGSWRRIELV